MLAANRALQACLCTQVKQYSQGLQSWEGVCTASSMDRLEEVTSVLLSASSESQLTGVLLCLEAALLVLGAPSSAVPSSAVPAALHTPATSPEGEPASTVYYTGFSAIKSCSLQGAGTWQDGGHARWSSCTACAGMSAAWCGGHTWIPAWDLPSADVEMQQRLPGLLHPVLLAAGASPAPLLLTCTRQQP